MLHYLRRLERGAAVLQGKGWGVATCEHEVRAIKKLLVQSGRPEPRVIFDVGANLGNWTQAALPLFPDATFYLFEPATANVEILKNKFAGHPIRISPVALSDQDGTATLFSDGEGSPLASLHQRRLEYMGIHHEPTHEVRTMSIDQFMKTEGLDRIDILKIDVEGHELAVLKGAADWLGKIGVIQFEFGGTQIDARIFFRDFWFLLSPQFRLYRLARFHLHPIPAYSESDECFLISNFVAVNKGM